MTLILLCLALNTDIVNQIADGIRKIENSTKFPYGIKSIELKGKTQQEKEIYARKICINSINNNFKRWENAGKPGDFFVFMNKRYCPPDTNWSNNLKSVLKRKNFNFGDLK